MVQLYIKVMLAKLLWKYIYVYNIHIEVKVVSFNFSFVINLSHLSSNNFIKDLLELSLSSNVFSDPFRFR